MNWLCWYVGTTTDPKFRVIAKMAHNQVGVVVAVWAYLLEIAGGAKERGSIASYDADVAEEALGFSASEIEAVIVAMREKGLIDGHLIAKWKDRQNLTNAERAKEWRKSKAEKTDVREHSPERAEQNDVRDVRANAPNKTNTTDRHTDRHTDNKNDAATPPGREENVASIVFDSGARFLEVTLGDNRKARSLIGKWVKEHGEEAVIAAIGRCQRAGAVEPVSYITACLQDRLKAKQTHAPPKYAASQPG